MEGTENINITRRGGIVRMGEGLFQSRGEGVWQDVLLWSDMHSGLLSYNGSKAMIDIALKRAYSRQNSFIKQYRHTTCLL